MKLNEQSKNELRKEIEEAVKRVPDGQRIHLDKELLDELIFFKGKNKQGTIIKVPIWTGEFLRKIDLSEISFENVLFQTGLTEFGDSIEEIFDAEDVSRFKNIDSYYYIIPLINDRQVIDFSYTNVNIDFSKIFGTTIEICNFEGIDLSKSNGECITRIFNSNFSNTNVRLNFNQEYFEFISTDFSNNDFSYATVDAKWFNSEDKDFRLSECNFSNTGLKIDYTTPYIPPKYYEEKKKRDELQKLFENEEITYEEFMAQDKKHREITSQYSTDDFYKNSIGEQIKEENLNGCYINGNKVLSLEERQDVAKQKKVEYEKMKEDLLSSTMSNIEEQIKGFKGK